MLMFFVKGLVNARLWRCGLYGAEEMVYISAAWKYSAYNHIEARVAWSGEDGGLRVAARAWEERCLAGRIALLTAADCFRANEE